MYAGRIIEVGTAEEIFYNPQHPYTWGLICSMPSLDTKDSSLYSIPGAPPNLLHMPKGDAFAPRNAYALAIDFEQEPPFFKVSDTHYAATWLLHPQAPKVTPPAEIIRRQHIFETFTLKGGTRSADI
jgi:oligopeptide transport system ATP-binding protein